MLRDPMARYAPGYSTGFLKYNVHFYLPPPPKTNLTNPISQKLRDAEAKVVSEWGENRWECELYCTLSSSLFFLSADICYPPPPK